MELMTNVGTRGHVLPSLLGTIVAETKLAETRAPYIDAKIQSLLGRNIAQMGVTLLHLDKMTIATNFICCISSLEK